MLINKTTSLGIGLLLAAGYLAAEAGQGMYSPAACTSPLGVPCAPKRESFGYYPVLWRRWPTDRAPHAATPVPESVPTPAPRETEPMPAPQTEEMPPAIEPLFPVPSESERTPERAPERSNIEDLFPPSLDDRPPAPPGDSTPPRDLIPPTEMTPPGRSIDSDATPPRQRAVDPIEDIFAPRPQEDRPPAMPQDDPFGDDPVQPGERRPGAAVKGPEFEVSETSGEPWRSSAKPAEFRATEPLPARAVAPSGAVEPSASVGPKLPETKSGKANPLREASAIEPGSITTRRVNPLR